jgi:hypothetical protein
MVESRPVGLGFHEFRATLDDAVAAFNRTERIKGKTVVRVVAMASRPQMVGR